MAKGSFNGILKGKKGNTVFYKVANSNNKEKQGLREYVPVVRNPKTDGQKYQRAIAATIMRAYAAGKAIFDHSFQGVQPGGRNMNHFRKVNMNLLRSLINAEVSNNTEAAMSQARVVAPGIVSPVPNLYQISAGSYDQNLFVYDDGFKLPAAVSEETVAAYAQRNGLVAGDIFTICMFVVDNTVVLFSAVAGSSDAVSKQFRSEFAFARLTVKDNLASNTDAVATLGQLFDIETSKPVPGIAASTTIATAITIDAAFNSKYIGGSIGIIRSRDNEDLRSNSVMVFEGETNFGIGTPYLIDAWSKAVGQLSQSPLILEGGNF